MARDPGAMSNVSIFVNDNLDILPPLIISYTSCSSALRLFEASFKHPTIILTMSEQKHYKSGSIPSMESSGESLTGETIVVVLGASGDLAQKKTFPALFALYEQNLLPKDVHIIGYARSSEWSSIDARLIADR